MKARESIQKIFILLILAVLIVFFFFPFAILLINAFKSNSQIANSPLSLPTAINFNHFKISMDMMHYYGSFLNSSIITIVSLVIILLFSSMAAHYFVRNNTKYSKFWFVIMIASMIIPFQAIMIPLVCIYGQKLGFIHSIPRLTLIFMYIGFGVPLAVFIYHGVIKSIPAELEEAAKIDGCNQLQIFFKIVLPLLVPTSVTIGILDVLWIWNDYLLPVVILQSAGPDKLTLPLAINVFQGTYTDDYEKFLPAVLLVILPVLIIYIFVQRYIIEGVTQGSIK